MNDLSPCHLCGCESIQVKSVFPSEDRNSLGEGWGECSKCNHRSNTVVCSRTNLEDLVEHKWNAEVQKVWKFRNLLREQS